MIVHIRKDAGSTHCGAAGESMSLEFWLGHVVPNREGCCSGLYKRLCRECDKLIPFTVAGARES